MKNLFPYEGSIRTVLGLALVWLSALSGWHVLLIPGAYLVYTASSRHCYIYAAMGINQKRSEKDYFLSLLPHYNPAPVFIFTLEGELKYHNFQAPTSLLKQIDILSVLPSIKETDHYSQRYQVDGAHYLVRFVPATDINLILCYTFDATRQFELQQEIIQTQKEII
ncbi:MAG: DUF2892 domain-containing protein [Pelovirga sp.]